MKTIYLAILIFSTIAEGANTISPCDEITWNAFECIQSLQKDILQLQDQVTIQADQLNIQSIQLNETETSLRSLQNTTSDLLPMKQKSLSQQAEPRHLWPDMIWSDISSQYAGLFFRVLGSGSANFNETQSESSPRISEVERVANQNARRDNVIIPSSGWSLSISTGGAPGIFAYWQGIRFLQSTAELRPRNKAVRIWQRIN